MAENGRHTYRLAANTDLLQLKRGVFGSRHPVGLVGYIPLPTGADASDEQQTRWRILLELTGEIRGLLPFEILDDVILGRDYAGSDVPDLDLSLLDAHDLGVSRQHAMLRPTESHLYLIDLGSTNGTLVNSVPLGQGRAHPLAEGDHISLAKLNMSIVGLQKVAGEIPGPDTDSLPKPSKRAGEEGGVPTERLQREDWDLD